MEEIPETMMTVRAYQEECVRLDRASGIATNPVRLGLVEEVGELCGKYKKVVRDHGGVVTDAFRDAITKEAGDVLWHVGMLGLENTYTLPAIVGSHTFDRLDYDAAPQLRDTDPMSELHRLNLTTAQVASGFLPVSVSTLRRPLDHLARFLGFLGISMEHVAKVNVAKLRDRAARGVLRGEGDNR